MELLTNTVTPNVLTRLLRERPIIRKNGFCSVEIDGYTIRHLPVLGKRYWFEYHCNESHTSDDAKLWYRSHQQVVVTRVADVDPVAYTTLTERCDCACQLLYKVTFDDGFEGTVFEDELMISQRQFCRPNPPTDPNKCSINSEIGPLVNVAILS